MAAVSPFGPEPMTYASLGELRVPLLMGVLPFEPTLPFEHFAERPGLQRYRRKIGSYVLAFPPQPAFAPFGRIRKVIFIQKRADVARRLIGKRIGLQQPECRPVAFEQLSDEVHEPG